MTSYGVIYDMIWYVIVSHDMALYGRV